MLHSDDRALHAAAQEDMALCTLIGIDGTFSRRRGAQLAVRADGKTFGSLSDGCLESQLAADCAKARLEGGARVMRYGKGSPLIDFRLPCGGGIDVLVDPAPDGRLLGRAVADLEARRPASLDLPVPLGASGDLLRRRDYIPALRVLMFGEGPEFDAFERMAKAAGFGVEGHGKGEGVSLSGGPEDLHADAWTAILLLFHDHEWEREILRWALRTPAFYIGAQGGREARANRMRALSEMGFDEGHCARVKSPIGLIPKARDPETLALSALSEIAARYGELHPHGDRVEAMA